MIDPRSLVTRWLRPNERSHERLRVCPECDMIELEWESHWHRRGCSRPDPVERWSMVSPANPTNETLLRQLCASPQAGGNWHIVEHQGHLAIQRRGIDL